MTLLLLAVLLLAVPFGSNKYASHMAAAVVVVPPLPGVQGDD
jgi:hypothetical protein